MKINKKQEGSKLVIALEGRLDTTSAPDLEKELKTSLDGVTSPPRACECCCRPTRP